jgi:hypothetical protein
MKASALQHKKVKRFYQRNCGQPLEFSSFAPKINASRKTASTGNEAAKSSG